MKILIVAFSDSIHTAKWINQMKDNNWNIFLYPSIDNGILNNEISSISIFQTFYKKNKISNNKIYGISVSSDKLRNILIKIIRNIFPLFHLRRLVGIIKKLKPDVIHSMEIQHAGYLVLDAKKILKNNFPKWIVTNWGSDIYLFGNLKEHKNLIREVLKNCDFYSCECDRDVKLGREFGFEGKIFKLESNAGGFNLEDIKKTRKLMITSKRKIITLKGYQGIFGRALVGLIALERCADIIKEKGMKIVVFSAENYPDVKIACELFFKKTNIQIEIIPQISHNKILMLHAKSRISISLSISDANSTSMLEAMAMGSFPIQSNTSAADEWLINNITGFIVSPEDPEKIASMINIALENDELVDKASEINLEAISNRLDEKILKKDIYNLYKYILDN